MAKKFNFTHIYDAEAEAKSAQTTLTKKFSASIDKIEIIPAPYGYILHVYTREIPEERFSEIKAEIEPASSPEAAEKPDKKEPEPSPEPSPKPSERIKEIRPLKDASVLEKIVLESVKEEKAPSRPKKNQEAQKSKKPVKPAAPSKPVKKPEPEKKEPRWPMRKKVLIGLGSLLVIAFIVILVTVVIPNLSGSDEEPWERMQRLASETSEKIPVLQYPVSEQTPDPLPVIAGTWAANSPVIDGKITDGEWPPPLIEKNITFLLKDTKIPGSMKASIMNDDRDLFVLLYLDVEGLTQEALNNTKVSFNTAVVFDEDKDGSTKNIEDYKGFWQARYCDYHREYNQNYYLTSWDDQQDGSGVYNYTDGVFVYEFQMPLDSGDSEDLIVKPGDVIGLRLTVHQMIETIENKKSNWWTIGSDSWPVYGGYPDDIQGQFVLAADSTSVASVLEPAVNPTATKTPEPSPSPAPTSAPVSTPASATPTPSVSAPTPTPSITPTTPTPTSTPKPTTSTTTTPGQPIRLSSGIRTGEISAAGEVDSFTFNGRTGDVLFITLADTSNTLDVSLKLYDQDGKLVTSNSDDGYAVINKLLTSYSLYTLKVSGGSNQTGLYTLSFNNVSEGRAPRIASGPAVLRQLDTAGAAVYFSFDGNAGDAVFITLADTNGVLLPVLKLYDPNGSEIGSDSDDSYAVINKQLALNGTYTIRVRDDSVIPQAGTYTLSFNKVSDNNALPISSGAAAMRTLDCPGEARYYSFNGKAGDVVYVTLIAPLGKLLPVLKLYDPNGNEIGSDSGDDYIVINKQLLMAGTYTIRVRDDNPIPKTGEYTLSFSLLSENKIPSLIYGSSLNGELYTPGEASYFTFYGKTGDLITVKLHDTSRKLLLVLKLYDPNGNEIGSDVDDLEATVSVKLPLSGTYTIRVRDDNSNPATGPFVLTLDFTPE